MKRQIKRLSPHQNAKVFGVLTALGSLVFFVPMALMFSSTPMGGAGQGPMGLMLVLFPLIYLVMGYISVAVGCLIYNFAFGFLGGFEYETDE